MDKNDLSGIRVLIVGARGHGAQILRTVMTAAGISRIVTVEETLPATHGGEAMMRSAVGVGTTMDVRLPYAAVGKDGARLRPKAEDPGARILPFRGAA